uniref:INTERNALIN B BINDING, LEUCINE RICH REPEAT.2A n=1 Tax=Siphoviridae sp. ctDmQ3 TaxID=2823570 RepID=A0A8S5L7Z0_9CAUD|nr:MAG TPA: INTERNALIN B BINDING, LEUCINE RICH REPEAT.2A [Siphoviridae sp. ctDmQ3]
MYMRNKKNKIITILMTLILLVCMPVTEVYAGTSTKTYGTDAFGETNGYLRLSQGTIKSCKYSKNGASAKTVTGDKRYVTYYTDANDGKHHRTYTGDSTYYEYVITDGYVYNGEKKECTVRIEYNGTASGTKAIEAGFEEESANNGKPAGITGSAGSTVKVTIEDLPSDFKCVMEASELDSNEGWQVANDYRAQDSVWIPSGAGSHVSVSDGCKALGLHEVSADNATGVCTETGKHKVYYYLKSDTAGKIVLYYLPGTANHASHVQGVSGSKVKYSANGKTASNIPEEDYSAWMSKYKIPYKTPTTMGYTFSHWNTKANGSGTTYYPKGYIDSLPSGTTTLYAQWIINSYKQIVKVRYQNADGTWGNYSDVINANYNYGSTVSWSRAADATYKAASISYTVTGANTKYVSVYRNTYLQIVKVRYQNADGTWGEYSDVINANYLYGSTVAWTRAADATYKAASISYTVTQVNTKYISVYRNTYIVTLYKGTGIDSVTGAGTYFYGQTATINATLTVGYKWINWTGTTTYSNISNSFTVDGDKTFTANAEPITYTVRFNGNGNWNISQGSYTQQFTYDLPATLTPNKFTRPDNTTYNSVNYIKGYEFIGWGTSATQTTATYTNGQSVSNLKNTDGAVLDLYAIWKKPVTLTFNFNGGKFNDSTANQVLNYTMYNSELSHTFDIKTYYGGFKNNRISANKGINNKLTKTDTNGIQYRFLGYSLNKNATVPDTQFDVYSLSRTENYTIRDNTTLYAVWEPVLQMTVQLSAPQHSGVMQLTSDVPVTTTLGNFKIPSGTRSTDIPSSATASVNTATIGTNVTNKDLVTYTVSAKGASNIKFSTAADSRILDIYTNGNNNTWFDKLNTTDKFEYTIDNFSNTTSSFTIPQYIGTKKSYKTSNPESATGTSVYAIKFTCTQPSYYYSKYWNSPESTSVYGILFLNPTLPDDNTNGDIILPPYAVEDGAYEFETILN